MINWKPGMKCVCICTDGGWMLCRNDEPCPGPEYGDVCEVAGISLITGNLGLILKGYPYCEGEGYWAMYFRPLDTLEEQLERIESEPIEEPELVHP